MIKDDADRTKQESKMIAISCAGQDIDSLVDPRFGRCSFFVLVSENDEITVIENSAANLASGAGIRAAQLMIDNKVEVVLTGNIGPNAYDLLKSAGVEIYSCSGRVRDALEQYKKDQLIRATGASARGSGGMRRFGQFGGK